MSFKIIEEENPEIIMWICPRCKEMEELYPLPATSKKGNGKGKSKHPHVWCHNCNTSFNPLVRKNDLKKFMEEVGIVFDEDGEMVVLPCRN